MPSERETRKLLIDPRLEADGWRVVSCARWLAGDRTAAGAVEQQPADSGQADCLLLQHGLCGDATLDPSRGDWGATVGLQTADRSVCDDPNDLVPPHGIGIIMVHTSTQDQELHV